MNRKRILKQIERQTMALMKKSKSKGHDFQHVDRTRKFALEIAKNIGYDLFAVELAALLHDIGNTVERRNHGFHSEQLAITILNKYPISEKYKQDILKAVREHNQPYATTKLGKILQDADKLDAMGAIGLMRIFEFNLDKYPLYDKNNPFKHPKLYKDGEGREYIKIDHLKHVSDVVYLIMYFEKMLNFPISRKMAKKKAILMKDFIALARSELK